MPNKSRLIILSPHLDDGVLSCGGLIGTLRGQTVVEIWTLFSEAPLRGPYSHAAQWLHGASSGLTGSRLARERRSEDRAACRVLGVGRRHFHWMDAVYRKDSSGRFLYRDCLRDTWHLQDEPIITAMTAALHKQLSDDDVLVAPLGLGNHVDHLIARQAAERLPGRTLLYYPDVPYVQMDPAESDRQAAGLWGFPYQLSPAHVSAWIAAIACYATQTAMLEQEAGPLPELIQKYAAAGLLYLFGTQTPLPAGLSAAPLWGTPHLILPAGGDEPRPRHRVKALSTLTSDSQSGPIPEWSASPLAPIALFAFKRLELLKKTLASLERCEGFRESSTHVFSDAARPHDPAEVADVSRLRSWLRDWCATHGAELHEASENLGLRRSIVSGVSSVLEKHERVIVLEDDLLLSRSFLVFINQALDAYASRDDLMQVSGYFVPHRRRLPAIGLLRTSASWGWGTWRRAWSHYRDDPEALLAELQRKDTDAFNIKGSYGYLEELERNATGTLDTWSIRWYASIFLQGGLTVYPATSFVRNIGFGDDATNCKPGPMDRVYSRQRIRNRRVSPDWQAVGSVETRAYADALEEFYRWQQHQWTKAGLIERLRASFRQRIAGAVPG